MKALKIAISIAAAMSVTSIGLEARAATYLSRSECIELANQVNRSWVAKCSKLTGYAYYSCMAEAYKEYAESLAICYATPAAKPSGGFGPKPGGGYGPL
jgi:hypothetical protein